MKNEKNVTWSAEGHCYSAKQQEFASMSTRKAIQMTNEKDNKPKRIPIEQFRLVLTHEFFDEDGKRHLLGEPLAVCCTNMWSNHASVAWTLNEILDKLRHELLMRYVRVGEQDSET